MPNKRAKPLKTQAIEILHRNRGKFRLIEKETGLDYQWLSSLSQGRIADPGVTRVERLIRWAQSK